MVTLVGVTAIDVRVLLTVRFVEPTTVPLVARIALVPGPTPVARPALLMVAMVGVAEDQVTVAVMSAVVASL